MSQTIDQRPDIGPPDPPISSPGQRVSAALLAAVGDREDWQQRALCAQTDPEAFFPEQGGSTAEAKAVCARCPVTAECLEHVLAHDERFGVWAGMSESERRKPQQAARVERAADLAAATTSAPHDQARPAARESAPPPGPSRHVGGTGPVATLPTEPRHPQGRPHLTRTRSTFPARARQNGPTDTPTPAAAPTAATPSSSRPSRPGATTGRRRRGERHGNLTAPAGPDLSTAPSNDPDDTAPRATTGTSDEAATVAHRPPDQASATPSGPGAELSAGAVGNDELLAAVSDVLATQPDAPDVDPADLAARPVGSGTDPGPGSLGEWELRILAVAWVISGRATRGQTARTFDVPSPAVAHWVARHQQQMPLCEQSEENLRC